jgi:hypothetical protein
MEINQPVWILKADKCGYCEEGELVFSQCPSCQIIILICAECGTAYEIQSRRRGEEVGDTSGATLCHVCAVSHQYEFPPATSQVIRGMGFEPTDYR